MLDAHIVSSSRGVDARLRVESGATLALLGANGAGKSTILECLAGIVSADAGSARLGSTWLHQGRSRLAPGRRGVAILTQDDTLFETMTVGDNVAYGLRSRRVSKPRARARAHEWLDVVGLSGADEARPGTLSGGQRRRVAIARALASEPTLMLLDEPCAGLDAEASTRIRMLLARLLVSVTAIVATHDAIDAHVLASHVAVLEDGAVTEHDSVDAVMERPRTAIAASVAGLVLLRGTRTATGIALDGGGVIAAESDVVVGAPALVAVRPADVRVARHNDVPLRPSARADGVIVERVSAIEPRGDRVRVHGARLAGDVDAATAAQLRLDEPVAFTVPHCRAYGDSRDSV